MRYSRRPKTISKRYQPASSWICRHRAATAANILSHESVFRLGFAVYLVELAGRITMIAHMYDLLKPAGRSGSLLAAIFGLIGCAVKILRRLFFFAPLLVLGEAHPLTGLQQSMSKDNVMRGLSALTISLDGAIFGDGPSNSEFRSIAAGAHSHNFLKLGGEKHRIGIADEARNLGKRSRIVGQ
jgi:hypothetical protein